MNIQPDFEECLALLEKHNVDYMIVSGYAVAFHGFPRFTKDTDIFFEPTPDNVRRLREVLVEFGSTENDLPQDSFETKGNLLSFGAVPVRTPAAAMM